MGLYSWAPRLLLFITSLPPRTEITDYLSRTTPTSSSSVLVRFRPLSQYLIGSVSNIDLKSAP